MVNKFDAIPTSYLFIGNSLTGNNDGVHTHVEALMTLLTALRDQTQAGAALCEGLLDIVAGSDRSG